MGQPTQGNACVSSPEHIGRARATGGTETSKYPEERKSKRDPPSSGERKGASPNRGREKRARAAAPGLRARCPGGAPPGRSYKAPPERKTHGKARGTGLEPRTRRQVPPDPRPRVPPGTRNPAGSRGDRPPRLSTALRPIADKYREGKVKSTPGGE